MPVGDTGAIAAALLDLIEDDGLRRRMGQAARENAARFDPALIAGRHEALFTELAAGRGAARSRSALRDGLSRSRGTLFGGAYGLSHRVAVAARKGRTA